MCREALQHEADVLCLLAKVEQSRLSFASVMPQSEGKESGSKGSSITAVVQEGLQVQIPMAGVASRPHIVWSCVASELQ